MSPVRVLLGHQWRRHGAALVVLAGAMFLFHSMITRVAPLPSQTQAFEGLIQLMPPALVRVLGVEFFNARGFIAFGYEHPFLLLIMGSWSVRVTAGSLAGEIGTGTMDLLAARPVRRSQMVRSALVTLLSGLGVIVVGGWIGTTVGLATRPALGFGASGFLPVVAGCWLLFAAFGAVGLVISTLRRDGGGAIAWTAGLIAASFALDYLARAWKPIAWMRRFSLFMYYRPEDLFKSGLVATDTVVLAVVAAIAAAAAFVIFRRRDL